VYPSFHGVWGGIPHKKRYGDLSPYKKARKLMSIINIVAQMNDSTVISEYVPNAKRSDSFQTEAELEQELIRILCSQGYEFIKIASEDELIQNLRHKLELLNNITFTDGEWKRFFRENLASENEGIEEKTYKIQEDYIQLLKREDGTSKNIYLLDKKNIHNNRLQVMHQYEAKDGNHENRYDVTLLVNGLPLVHIELKRRGVAVREAFNQINRYQRESFWSGGGLFEYVQIFVISNGTNTKYYSNTTRNSHIKEQSQSQRRKSKKTSNSFEFTSYWADANNKLIADLVDFAKTFLAKHTLLNILSRFCVFTTQKLLLVMRPYQIAATERILNRIEIAHNYKKAGSLEAGGYVWHTTGSGKTLTSFKTSQLACNFPFIDKVLFVVDRKDLDYQTMDEYNKFQEGCVSGTTSTKILQKQLEDSTSKIIITTIQKLDVFISQNKSHEVYKKNIVLIFDECHRSQFGQMHNKIIKAFKNYFIFGFTGTPIFADNAASGASPFLKTTEQALGEKLHTYTIVDAINDGNVLPFRIDYINTVKRKDDIADMEVQDIDREKALDSPLRVREIVKYVLEHFDQKTNRGERYSLRGKRLNGFNSIFAVSSIPMAIMYYNEFKKQCAETGKNLAVATIFSFTPNEDDIEQNFDAEDFGTDRLDQSSRDFLESAVADYNKMFNQSFDTSSQKFQNYYKDVSKRVKNREVDLLIVVNMFLTGFDATTLNTLWVDKNLRMHGLIQAYSRTNRILNSVKKYGNIVCFRDLQKETDEAIALFGNREAGSVVLIKNFDSYYYGYDENGRHVPGYSELVDELLQKFPLGEPVTGEEKQKEFIRLFGAILRMKNLLSAFDEFQGMELVSPRDFQDYQSRYLDLYGPRQETEKTNINDDIVFELELIRQVEVNIDYILVLVEEYNKTNKQDKDVLTSIQKAVGSSTQLRSKKELIDEFIRSVNADADVTGAWADFMRRKKEEELERIIQEEKLQKEQTVKFVHNAFRDGVLNTNGTDIDKILPPMPLFGKDKARTKTKNTVIARLTAFFEKYFGVMG